MIKFGSDNISKIKIGNETMAKVFVGAELVFTESMYRDASWVTPVNISGQTYAIETSYKPTNNTLVEANIYVSSSSRLWYSDSPNYNGSATNFRGWFTSDGTFTIDSKYATPNLTSYYNQWVVLKHSKNGIYINNVLQKAYSATPNAFTSSTPLKICGNYKIKYLKVYNNDILQVNLKSVQEKSSGNFGLLDTISNTFYGSSTYTGQL